MKKGIIWIGILFIGIIAALFCGRVFSGRDDGAGKLKEYAASFLDQMLAADDGPMEEFLAGEWERLLAALGLTEYQQDELDSAFLLFGQQWEMAGYEVVSGDFTEAGYSLLVRLYPVDGLIRFLTRYDAYVADFQMRNQEEAFGSLTDEEYLAVFQEGLVGLMEEAFGSAAAAPAVEKKLLLFRNDDGEYEVSEADFIAIREALVPLE